LLAGLAGGVAWMVGVIVIFGPAQKILTDPTRQSAKFLAVWTQEPVPRNVEAPWILPAGLLVLGMCLGLAYHASLPAWRGSPWARGRRFGFIAWLIAMPWFEFYLPFNVMREPFSLVLVELVCWWLVFQLIGAAIAWVYEPRAR
jgi:hypothetical protein